MHFLKFQVFTVYIIGAIPVLAAKNGDDVYKFPTRRAEKYYWNMVDMCHVKHELELILKFGGVYHANGYENFRENPYLESAIGSPSATGLELIVSTAV